MDDRRFGLYLILTNPLLGYERLAEAAVQCKVRYLQLRMKHAPEDEVLQNATKLREITKGSDTLFIVNDSVEIARAVDADGVHLGQGDMPLPEARALWPIAGKRFGLSTHNPEQEKQARLLAPDIIGVGPVYSTPTKEIADPTVGLEQMQRIIEATPLVPVAIGGINKENLATVLQHGAVNFAVVRAVNQASDPERAIEELMDIWKRHIQA